VSWLSPPRAAAGRHAGAPAPLVFLLAGLAIIRSQA
jgi:hypothetical protein